MARTKHDEKRAFEAKKAKLGKDNTDEAPQHAPVEGEKKARKKRRNPKRWAQEVKRFQKPLSASKYIPWRPFKKLCREIAQEARPDAAFRCSPQALKLLHEVAVDFTGDLFLDANELVVNRSGHTLKAKDLKLANKLMQKSQQRFSSISPSV